MHNEIKDYHLTGTVGWSNIVETRERLIREVENDMRDDGYAPLLDLEPQFSRSYNSETETFDFHVTVYGMYVGEEEAWQIAGLANGRPVPKYTPKNKSQPS